MKLIMINATLKLIGTLIFLYGAFKGLEMVMDNPRILIPMFFMCIGVVVLVAEVSQPEYSETVDEQIKDKL